VASGCEARTAAGTHPSCYSSFAMNRQTIAVLAFAFTACAVPEKSRMSDAATTPLSDLNLVHASIPAVLVDAQKPAVRLLLLIRVCTALAAEA